MFSSFWLLQLKVLGTRIYKSMCRHMLSFLLGKYLRVPESYYAVIIRDSLNIGTLEGRQHKGGENMSHTLTLENWS